MIWLKSYDPRFFLELWRHVDLEFSQRLWGVICRLNLLNLSSKKEFISYLLVRCHPLVYIVTLNKERKRKQQQQPKTEQSYESTIPQLAAEQINQL